jgi:hypothetical protein
MFLYDVNSPEAILVMASLNILVICFCLQQKQQRSGVLLSSVIFFLVVDTGECQ